METNDTAADEPTPEDLEIPPDSDSPATDRPDNWVGYWPAWEKVA